MAFPTYVLTLFTFYLYLLLTLSACGESSSSSSSNNIHSSNSTNGMEYTFTLSLRWSQSSHPTDWPAGAHFSGIVGASHNQDYSLYQIGQKASRGVQIVAETGAGSILKQELESKKEAGSVNVVFSSAGPSLSSNATFKVTVSKTHPFVSLITMIAPSPDWFLGISNFNMLKNNAFINTVNLPLYPLDAGTDSGTTYGSANSVTNPAQPISPLSFFDFEKGTPGHISGIFDDIKMFRRFGDLTITPTAK